MMRTFKIITVALALIFTSSIYAQNGVLKNEYKANANGWLVNIDEAYAISKKTGKPIMANFTGSDWCGWCKKLKREVFDMPGFKKWADKNVVLLELDFPRTFKLPNHIQQQNAGLQKTFGVRGYPTIWVFNLGKDAATKQYAIEALGKTGYARGIAAFTQGVDAIIAQGKQ